MSIQATLTDDAQVSETPAMARPTDYTGMKVADLKAELKQRSLPLQGKKADLVARLQANDEKDATPAKRKADEAPEGEAAGKRAKVEEDPIPAPFGGTAKDEPADAQIKTDAEEQLSTVDDNKPIETESEPEPAAGDDQAQILERGSVYFFYRPKVDAGDDADSLDDIAHFAMLLRPRGSDRIRHIDVGRKQLPDTEGGSHRPFWAAVTSVSNDMAEIGQELAHKEYTTKTRGPRVMPAARPAGRGQYLIHVKGERSKRSTHLCYVLTQPEQPGAVQDELSIHKEGAFAISVKDPHVDGARGASLKPSRRAEYPKELQDLFHTKFRLVEPASFLDYAGSELLLIAAKRNVADEVGAAEAEKLEDAAEHDVEDHKDMFQELHLDHREFPADPLEGQWA